MNHEQVEELASRFIDNELDAAGEAEMFLHLKDCTSCRGFLRTSLLTRTSLLRDAPLQVPERLDKRIDALVRKRPPVLQPSRWREFVTRRFLIPAPAAIAALLFILLSFGALVATIRIRSQEQAQLASGSSYMLLMPEVEVRGVYQTQSQNIR